MEEIEESMLCQDCGKDSDKLYALHSGKDRQGNCHWVCIDCAEGDSNDN